MGISTGSSEIELLRGLEALRAINEEYQLLLDAASDSICSFDPDGRYRYVNQAFANGLGCQPVDIIGKNIGDIFSQDEADKRFAVVQWVFAHGQSKIVEVRVPRPGGDRYFVTTVKPIVDSGGVVVSVICTSKDITDRKVMEAELERRTTALEHANKQAQQSLATIHSILDTAPVGISVLDAELRHTHINQKYVQTTGYSVEELLTHTHQRFFPSRLEFEQFIERISRVIASGKTYSEERQNIYKNGSLVWVCIQVNAVDPKDFRRGFVIAIEDISGRKQAEQEIRESHQRLENTLRDLRTTQEELIQSSARTQSILDAAPIGIYLVDENVRITHANTKFFQFTGRPSEKLIGRTPQRLFPSNEDFEGYVARAAKSLAEGRTYIEERSVVGKDGALLWARTQVCAVVPGEPEKGMVATIEDISDRKHAEQEIKDTLTKFQSILDTAPVGISLLDAQLRHTHVNKKYVQITGYLTEEWLGKTHQHVFPSEYEFELYVQRTSGALLAGQTYREEIQLVHPDGFPRWLNTQINAIDPKDFSRGFVIAIEEISGRKKTEKELKDALAITQSILDSSPLGISLFDSRLRHKRVNTPFERLTGYTADEIYGHTAHRFFSSTDKFLEFVERAMNAVIQGQIYFEELQLKRKSGNLAWIRLNITLLDPKDPNQGTVIVFEDISDRKKSEQVILESHQALQTTQNQLRLLLDNSGEGFLTFGPDLLIDAQYSLACETMLGCSPAGCPAAEVFFHDDPVKANLFGTIITSVLSESDPDTQECMLSLLPTEIARAEIILKVEYKALDNSQFMVVLTDITAQRHTESLLRQERQRLELIVMAVSDRRNFFETIDAFREFLGTDLPRMLQSRQAPLLLAKDLYREIHTYKGLLSQFSFPSIPKVLHEIESRLASLLSLGEALTIQQLGCLASSQTLQAPFEADLAVLSEALGEEFLLYGDSIVLTEAQARQLEMLAIRLLRGETVDTSVAEIRNLLHAIGTLCKVSFKDVLMGFDGLVKQAAQRMEKEVAPIEVLGVADIWIDPNAYRPFFRTLVHVFRNAVAHGLETPEARWEAEKDDAGKITCTVALQDNTIHLCIADDGAGINLQALRQRAITHGIYAADAVAHIPDDTIAQLIFRDNISTKKEVSDLAGRGIGLAAVLNATKNIGGAVVVRTMAGQGTRFLFTLPLQPAISNKEACYVQ
ncbi:MAG: PAS domain S-box protein [Rhodoferax sp.]|nr:PAS domain S-box protein [Rhodoferax sp.]